VLIEVWFLTKMCLVLQSDCRGVSCYKSVPDPNDICLDPDSDSDSDKNSVNVLFDANHSNFSF
jgi:hypothetical protein